MPPAFCGAIHPKPAGEIVASADRGKLAGRRRDHAVGAAASPACDRTICPHPAGLLESGADGLELRVVTATSMDAARNPFAAGFRLALLSGIRLHRVLATGFRLALLSGVRLGCGLATGPAGGSAESGLGFRPFSGRWPNFTATFSRAGLSRGLAGGFSGRITTSTRGVGDSDEQDEDEQGRRAPQGNRWASKSRASIAHRADRQVPHHKAVLWPILY